MAKPWIFLFAILVILVGTLLLNFLNASVSGNSVKKEFDYSFTKAICDGENFCEDYEIKCNGNETIELTPITGAFIQQEENWKDPRNETEINNLCD